MTSKGSVTISLLSRRAMIAITAATVMLSACAPTVQPTVSGNGPGYGFGNGLAHTASLTTDRYVAADGTSLPVAVWPANPGPPKAVILGLHGFGDYRNAWDEPAQIWAKDGFTTYSYDQRGFGGSPTRGRWPGTEALGSDALCMLTLLHQEYPGVPIYLAGESMGGAVSQGAAPQGAQSGRVIFPARAAP